MKRRGGANNHANKRAENGAKERAGGWPGNQIIFGRNLGVSELDRAIIMPLPISLGSLGGLPNIKYSRGEESPGFPAGRRDEAEKRRQRERGVWKQPT
jgi:hypothetical protein